ncbi:DUF1330 domain-containing protein [Limibaculum sp. M0105]|uniref:DUF1330 domain-containing protein n=1 Tax=Thermohalobaculum xanthum TaxID=2753746 RepID=A0A8J7M510_9RHOB|nr:DUF1330 domain-containing protein [Thermohalobaculum xanthum]MBK0398591.1 DUF1330 domain-containing protein [Thermohalobaculum xanthum]
MPKGYWIASVRVDDAAKWQQYVEAARPAFAEHGGRFLARGGAQEEAESALGRSRHVICEFPSLAAAQACYHSAEYQAARKLREGAGIATITLLEGLE